MGTDITNAIDVEREEEVARLNHELRRNLILEASIIAFGLGSMFMVCVGLICYGWITHSDHFFALGLYLLVVHVSFHCGEFFTAAVLRPHDTHPDAFMIYHSRAYIIASAAALLEFLVESFLIPESWKLDCTFHPCLGLFFRVSRSGAIFFSLCTAFFYLLRVAAMVQCGANFSLMIEYERRGSHDLVTHGLYRYLRHPSYFGWFWRTCCAQFIVANPICAVLHTAVTWYFFHERVAYEEETMERADYFGTAYTEYATRTFVGIPFCGRPRQQSKKA